MLFVPEADGTFAAYDATNGKKLWTHNNGQGHNGGIITYMAKGKQYVAVDDRLGFAGRRRLRRLVWRAVEEHAEGLRRAEGICAAISGTTTGYICRSNQGGEFVPALFYRPRKQRWMRCYRTGVREIPRRLVTRESIWQKDDCFENKSALVQSDCWRGPPWPLAWPAALLADEPNPRAKPFDVKSTFRNICGFCHENYGRKAAKGPQLMNSERSDEFLFNRIKNGMPGRMAAFGSAFNDDQIRQIVIFIRNLKPGEEPQNP